MNKDKTLLDIFNDNNQNSSNSEWPIWAMFVIRDVDNIRNEFYSYREVNDQKTRELVEKLISKYEENKEDMLKMKVTFGLFISVVVSITGIISAVFSDVIKNFILKLFN